MNSGKGKGGMGIRCYLTWTGGTREGISQQGGEGKKKKGENRYTLLIFKGNESQEKSKTIQLGQWREGTGGFC